MKTKKIFVIMFMLIMIASLLAVFPAGAAPSESSLQAFKAPKPKFSDNVAFDVSPTLRDMAAQRITPAISPDTGDDEDIREERGTPVTDLGFLGDGAVQNSVLPSSPAISGTLANFEGLSN
ncbi:MAG: hypothetical protein ABI986_06915, partial [Chloroflexota bacterium]